MVRRLQSPLPGLLNPHLWPADSGGSLSIEEASRRLFIGRERGDQGVTFLGGEPFQQPQALAALCAFVQSAWPSAPNIPRLILYSGYTFETLRARANPAIDSALAMADVLIDGPFVAAQADESLAYRGSRNQRVIDLPQTLSSGHLTTLNWDRPRIQLTAGRILLSPALANRIGLPAVAARHCGELPATAVNCPPPHNTQETHDRHPRLHYPPRLCPARRPAHSRSGQETSQIWGASGISIGGTGYGCDSKSTRLAGEARKVCGSDQPRQSPLMSPVPEKA